ncbi:MMPL family transporter [Streptomyces sp. 6N223]|uniref:MMPL family transporter n=1 Tax=Streptomyces sp. 6N223 TaxID=3457412 RepID=UPI003FD2C3B7
MFASLGRLAHRRPKTVLVVAALFAAFGAVWGTGVFGELTGGGFRDEGSESALAEERLAEAFGRQNADVLVLYDSEGADGLTVDDPAYREAVESSLLGVGPGLLSGAVTYWDRHDDSLVSADRTTTYAVLTLAGGTEDARDARYAGLEEALGSEAGHGALRVRLGGPVALTHGLSEQSEADITRAEALAMPLLLALLLVIFGSLVSAAMPLLTGVLTALGGFTLLRAFSLAGDVSVFSVNVVTMMGLGLAIDYSLFIVSRFREELRAGRGVEEAIERTLATAGRTVAFSGLVVGISLAGLLLFPLVFLRSMGLGGMAAVAIAVTGSLTVLPAVLSLLGHRVDALRVPRPWRRRNADDMGSGTWYRVAHSVMRRPLVYLAVIVVGLVALGLPFRNVEFGSIDERVMPTGTESRLVGEEIARDFPAGDAAAVEVVVTGADAAALDDYMARLGELPEVTGVRVGLHGHTSQLLVRHELGEYTPEARELVREVRATPAPGDAEVLVGGGAADVVDQLDGVGERLPWMIAFVALVTLVVLFLAFGSVLLPVKALIANVLSLTASFGALVWIFQYGHLAEWLDFTPTGTIEASQPVLMFAIAFGLSMDYEVFLLSRVREEWDRTGDNAEAVASGLQRTGSIITSAALLLIIVVGAFATSGISIIKMVGVGLVIAIAVDAVLVRTLLVPATMRLLGRANWWAPGPLARFWERHGHREEG